MLHVPGDSLLARRVLQVFLALPRLPGITDVPVADLEVVLAPDEDALSAATGGRLPDWSAGVALPAAGRVVLPTGARSELRGAGAVGLLRHEWAHVATYRASGGLRAPRWFSEGYAEWAAGWDRTRAWRLRLALAVGGAPPLDSIALAWPAGRAPAESAYLLAASVVEYLVESSGERGLEAFFRRWRESGSFEESLRRTYGLTTGQLEEAWAQWVRRRYGWLYVLTHSGIAWTVLAGLLVAMVTLRRRYNREKMARLRAREIPDAPAYWSPPAQGTGEDGRPGRGDPGPGAGGTSNGGNSPSTSDPESR